MSRKRKRAEQALKGEKVVGYEWCGRSYKADPSKLVEEWYALASPEGRLNVDTLIEWARNNPDSEWHKLYEWDLETAAWEYWRRLTREVQNSLAVVVEKEPQKPPVRATAFYGTMDRKDPGGSYATRPHVRDNRDLAEDLRTRAMSSLRSAEARLKELAELTGQPHDFEMHMRVREVVEAAE